VAELRRRLKAERGVRKACERWLRAELRTRVCCGCCGCIFGGGGRGAYEVEGLKKPTEHANRARNAIQPHAKQQEEMEALLLAIRDTAFGRPAAAAAAAGGGRGDDGVRNVEVLIDSLQSSSAAAAGGGRPRQPPAAAAEPSEAAGVGSSAQQTPPSDASTARREFAKLKQRLHSDGSKLKEQVASAKALLRERLGAVGVRGGGGG